MVDIVTMFNLVAQERICASEVIEIYKNGSEKEQRGFRNSVIVCFLQAKPTNEEELEATESRDRNGIDSLEHFEKILQLFCSADTRRRETLCKDGCYHEWHNLPENFDLAD